MASKDLEQNFNHCKLENNNFKSHTGFDLSNKKNLGQSDTNSV